MSCDVYLHLHLFLYCNSVYMYISILDILLIFPSSLPPCYNTPRHIPTQHTPLPCYRYVRCAEAFLQDDESSSANAMLQKARPLMMDLDKQYNNGSGATRSSSSSSSMDQVIPDSVLLLQLRQRVIRAKVDDANRKFVEGMCLCICICMSTLMSTSAPVPMCMSLYIYAGNPDILACSNRFRPSCLHSCCCCRHYRCCCSFHPNLFALCHTLTLLSLIIIIITTTSCKTVPRAV